MKCKILTATSVEGLQEAITNELSTGKASEIMSVSISVYNGLYYCLIAYKGVTG